MGLTAPQEMEVKDEHALHHFSHQHPLRSAALSSGEIITCYGCNLNIISGKDYYSCKICDFSLHKVCANLPRKTRHPSHPDHFLSLYVLPESGDCSLKCKACNHRVDGFYYGCGECNINYHVLCLALPLSVQISSHHHKLKMEFSPPYDFFCDLCNKPSYKGWLYRCRFCEFDAHISCALTNQIAQAVPVPRTLTRQIIYSSASITEANRTIDYGNENNEHVQLVIQGIMANNATAVDHQDFNHKTVSRWDNSLNSPEEKFMEGNGKYHGETYLLPPKPLGSDSPADMSISQNPEATSVSEQDLTIPSYQFSDMCFSIDLLRSYSSYHDDAIKEKDQNHKLPIHDSNRAKQLLTNPLYQDPENRKSKALLASGFLSSSMKLDHLKKRTGNVRERRLSMENRRIKSVNSRKSGFWRIIGCFCLSKHDKCLKSLKNGGL